MASQRMPLRDDDLLLREVTHRASNDLQLVVSLLAMQSRRTTNEETRQALKDAMERIAVIARSRDALNRAQQTTLGDALAQVRDALNAHAEARGIRISVEVRHDPIGLTSRQVSALALVANELATNAIKHGFEEDTEGRIRILVDSHPAGDVVVTVDDDGLPIPDEMHAGRIGLGMELGKRLMASINGLFIPLPHGSKVFELRLPSSALYAAGDQVRR